MARFLTRNDIIAIPENYCPMPVLSDNIRSLISWGIKVHEKGNYNHFMWYLGHGLVASQDAVFHVAQVKDYFKRNRLKFWYCPSWTAEQREMILNAVRTDILKPWYKRLYDPLAIVGQLIHFDRLQIPGIDICSDKGAYLKLVDPNYSLKHPDPENINAWLESQNGKYQVYGRYVPD